MLIDKKFKGPWGNLRNYESQILEDESVTLVPKTCSSLDGTKIDSFAHSS